MTIKIIGSIIIKPYDIIRIDAARAIFFEARNYANVCKIGQNIKFDYYLDNAEYTATHIMKCAMCHVYGAKFVRWPHSFLVDSGLITSFLAYDIYFSSGKYDYDNFGHSWFSQCNMMPIGIYKNDKMLLDIVDDSNRYKEFILASKSAGKKIIVYFSSSSLSSMNKVNIDIVQCIADVISNRDDCLLVIKSKGLHSYNKNRIILEEVRNFRNLESIGKIINIEYLDVMIEPCSAVWLIENMDIGVSPAGSVQIEALLKEKLSFAYLPNRRYYKYMNILKEHGLYFESMNDIKQAIRDVLDAKSEAKIPHEWLKDNFDVGGESFDILLQFLWGNSSSVQIVN